MHLKKLVKLVILFAIFYSIVFVNNYYRQEKMQCSQVIEHYLPEDLESVCP